MLTAETAACKIIALMWKLRINFSCIEIRWHIQFASYASVSVSRCQAQHQ
jgi:hypothetical protein